MGSSNLVTSINLPPSFKKKEGSQESFVGLCRKTKKPKTASVLGECRPNVHTSKAMNWKCQSESIGRGPALCTTQPGEKAYLDHVHPFPLWLVRVVEINKDRKLF